MQESVFPNRLILQAGQQKKKYRCFALIVTYNH